ncbi:hypothetical protein [Nonomuraea sp. LPB2021202275-12-8]|uniref:hypothetical protein n=1 Tax=Nonomuraea sp. LPB2021202275-12-8 TaxID=3120159 RepID=UPI00300DBE1A
MSARRLAHTVAVSGCIAYALLICELALSGAHVLLTVTMAMLGIVSVVAAILSGQPKVQRDVAYRRVIISEMQRMQGWR